MFKQAMTEFLYSAWFTDLCTDPTDQDREWVACIAIEATSAKDAQHWGDVISHDRAARLKKDRFVESSVELASDALAVTDWSSLPRIHYGQSPSDQEVGW
ncbi:hypothetical protein [Novosphingobium sp. Rr 2-17]|uniref:hypothetical protein n=1 Tax=Novosphingobium sp. Rr 2-17 TaxID=555793 RepID=UPI0005BD3978|nr:hypothetical protein [Novosphingobium sp. Rr 2-17]